MKFLRNILEVIVGNALAIGMALLIMLVAIPVLGFFNIFLSFALILFCIFLFLLLVLSIAGRIGDFLAKRFHAKDTHTHAQAFTPLASAVSPNNIEPSVTNIQIGLLGYCPECGLGIPTDELEYKELMQPGGNSEDTVDSVYCAYCEQHVPLFLVERRNGMSSDEAQSIWRKKYRPLELAEESRQLATKDASPTIQKNSDLYFVCPECGSQKTSGRGHDSINLLARVIKWPDGTPFVPAPIAGDFHICANCHSKIPNHIGFRTDSISQKDAAEKWIKYKNKVAAFDAVKYKQESMTLLYGLIEYGKSEYFDDVLDCPFTKNLDDYLLRIDSFLSIINEQLFSNDALGHLIKALTIYEEKIFGGLGSATKITEIYKRISDADRSLADWIRRHSANPYLLYVGGAA